MFCAQDYGIATGQKLQVAAKKCMGWSCFSVKKSVFGQRMLLKSKKHLDEILPLIKSQPLLREIVIAYIVKDLSKREIHYVIYSYQPNYKTRRYNSSTKSRRLWSVTIQDSKLHLIILAPILYIFALTRKDWIKVKAYKAQCCGRSKTTTLETMKEKG